MKARLWIGLAAGLAAAGLGFAALARAQAPAVPVLPGAVAPAAAPTNFWSRILLTPEQKANCRDLYCKSGIGKMANGFTAPLNFVTGGLITDHCLTNAIEKGLEQPADSAVGAAARIKADEAAAKARREAVRYLGTVDCNWWPEAEAALIKALRQDTNECVRWEAAIALSKGCCCTKKVIDALAVSVSGSSRDNNPPENSDRVRATAAEALGHCVAVYIAPPSERKDEDPLKKPEEEQKRTELSPSDYYKQVSRMSRAAVIERARQDLQAATKVEAAPAGAPVLAVGPTRPTSVAAILSGTFYPPTLNSVVGDGTAAPALNSEVATAGGTGKEPGGVTQAGSPGVAASKSGPVVTERKGFFDGLTRSLKGKQTGRSLVTIPSNDPAPAKDTPEAPTTPEKQSEKQSDKQPEKQADGQPVPVTSEPGDDTPARLPVGDRTSGRSIGPVFVVPAAPAAPVVPAASAAPLGAAVPTTSVVPAVPVDATPALPPLTLPTDVPAFPAVPPAPSAPR